MISAPRDFVHKAHLGPDDMGMGSAQLLSLQGMQKADVRKNHDEFITSNEFSSRLQQVITLVLLKFRSTSQKV